MDYNRKEKKIRLTEHAIHRSTYWGINVEQIEETIRTGKVYPKKSKQGKICIQKYFGKENRTCTVIVTCYKQYIEVLTTWEKKGN
jgi:hypothetical protein